MFPLSVIQEIRCANCGAPISFKPVEIIATCRYCGFTGVIETGRVVAGLRHSFIMVIIAFLMLRVL